MKTTMRISSGNSTRTILSLGLFLFITVHSAIGFSAAPPKSAELAYYGAGFYSDLKSGVRDESLKTEIRTILRGQHVPQNGGYDQIVNSCTGQTGCYGHKVLGYFNARVLLMGQMYLVNQGNEYAVHDVYCNSNRKASEFGSKPPAPNQIPQETIVNTEHTWPQSRFNSKYAPEEQKSDVHHLFPTDSKINATRGNHEFGEVQKDLQSLSCSESRFGLNNASGAEPIFEPPQVHKGHVARALFYFSIRYELPISANEEATLKKWNKENPPDQNEIENNNIIYKAQGSRNPFIDYPELADQIADF
jgi:endonuclease I